MVIEVDSVCFDYAICNHNAIITPSWEKKFDLKKIKMKKGILNG
jgi:hypothetical protein